MSAARPVGGVPAATAAAFAIATAADEDEVVDDDLGAVDLLAAVLIVPGAGGEAAFDVELVALLDVVADDLGGAAISDGAL